jgi:hypothetical protein
MDDPRFNPFPGLRSFDFGEQYLFFGREGQSEEILGRLRKSCFLSVVGTSGSGKSSLIRAGLLPDLYGGYMTGAGTHWRVAIFRPMDDPIGNMARALNKPDVLQTDPAAIADQARSDILLEVTLRRSGLGLIEAARLAGLPANENLLVVVDQFEELFRFADTAKSVSQSDDAAAFVKLLLEASRQTEFPIYVVITMRSDFIGDCARFSDLAEAITAGMYLIPRMTREQRRRAIEEPVAVGGGAITPRLVNRLLNEAGDNPDQLPILQHVLMRTWEQWVARTSNVQDFKADPMDLADFEAIGGLQGALSNHADEAYQSLPDERHREIARRMFQSLTEKGTDNRAIRRPTRVSEIMARSRTVLPEVLGTIEAFRKAGRSFLTPLEPVQLNDDSVIDISHESLIRGWKRLTGWVDEESESADIFRRLAQTAELHGHGRADLYHDPELQIALDVMAKENWNEEWALRYHQGFKPAMTFLEESRRMRDAAVAEREAETTHKLRRTRLVAAAFGIVLLGTLLALTKISGQRNELESKQKEVSSQREKASLSAQEAEKALSAKIEREESQAKENVKRLQEDSLDLKPGVLDDVQMHLQNLEADSREAPASENLRRSYAEYLALAAEVFNGNGRFEEGGKRAEQAIVQVDQLRKNSSFDYQALDLIEAEACYALASSLSEVGRLGASKSNFEKAIALVQPVRNVSSRQAKFRILELSKIGLAKVDDAYFSLNSAQQQFKAVIEELTPGGRSPAIPDQVLEWKALALRGLARSLMQIDDEKAFSYLHQASQTLHELRSRHPENLRWQELYADVSLLQAGVALDLHRFAEASQFQREAFKTSRMLSNLDPANLNWQFLLSRSYRGAGEFQEKAQDLERAKLSYEKLRSTAREITQKQPTWFQPGFLEFVATWHLGVVAQALGDASQNIADTTKNTDEKAKQNAKAQAEYTTASSEYETAVRKLADIIQDGKELPEYFRSLSLVDTWRGDLEVSRKNWQLALELYNRALQAMSPIGKGAAESPRILNLKAYIYYERARAYQKLRSFPEASESCIVAAKIYMHSHELARVQLDPLLSLADVHMQLAAILEDAGQQKQASLEYKIAIETIDGALRLAQQDRAPDTRVLLKKALIEAQASDFWLKENDLTQSVSAREAALDAAKKAFNYEPYNYDAILFIKGQYDSIGKRLTELTGKPTDSPGALQLKAKLEQLKDASNITSVIWPEGSKEVGNILEVRQSQNWILPPLMDGSWQTLVPIDRAEEEKRLDEVTSIKRLFSPPLHIIRIRLLPLNFYDQARLFEAEIGAGGNEIGIINYVRTKKDVIVLDGRSAKIRNDINDKIPLNINSIQQASDYLRFFVGSLQAELGRFILVEDAAALHWLPNVPQVQHDQMARIIRPLLVHESSDGTWAASGTLQYSNDVFYAFFKVHRNGKVEMSHDQFIATARPIVAEHFSDGIRVLWTRQTQLKEKLKEISRALDKNPGGETRRDLGKAAADLSRTDAGEEDYRGAQEARTLAIKAYEPLGQGPSPSDKDRDSLASAYGGRSFLDLFVGDWKNALSDADDGLKVDPSEIWILTNKAHALLFLGRTTEARKIYLENALKKAFPKDPKSKRFLDAVLDDFEQFRKHPPPGIDLKIIDPIESELKKVQADASNTVPIVK